MRKNSLDYKTILNLYLAMPTHSRSIRKLHTELLRKYEQNIKLKTISRCKLSSTTKDNKDIKARLNERCRKS